MDYQNIDFNKDVVTMYSQLRERANGSTVSYTVLFTLRNLVAVLLKSKKNRRGMAWSCCCWSMSMSTSIKNSSSCAQANNIGNTADNVKTNWWLHWQVVTSPFNRAKKKLTRVSRDWPNPHLARDHVNVKFDAELTRVRAQPGVV